MSVKRKRTSSKGGPTTKRRRYLNYGLYGQRSDGLYGRFSKKGGETKFFDKLVSHAVTTSGVIEPSLNLIPQGVTESERVGRKCTITKISLRGEAVVAQDTSLGSREFRILVYLDKQANGAAASVTDILETASTLSFNNLANSQRFVTLKDWYLHLNAGAHDGTDYNHYGRVLKWHRKCNIPLEFSGTTGAITELRSNNIGILAVVDESTVGTPSISLRARIRFTDQ